MVSFFPFPVYFTTLKKSCTISNFIFFCYPLGFVDSFPFPGSSKSYRSHKNHSPSYSHSPWLEEDPQQTIPLPKRALLSDNAPSFLSSPIPVSIIWQPRSLHPNEVAEATGQKYLFFLIIETTNENVDIYIFTLCSTSQNRWKTISV